MQIKKQGMGKKKHLKDIEDSERDYIEKKMRGVEFVKEYTNKLKQTNFKSTSNVKHKARKSSCHFSTKKEFAYQTHLQG